MENVSAQSIQQEESTAVLETTRVSMSLKLKLPIILLAIAIVLLIIGGGNYLINGQKTKRVTDNLVVTVSPTQAETSVLPSATVADTIIPTITVGASIPIGNITPKAKMSVLDGWARQDSERRVDYIKGDVILSIYIIPETSHVSLCEEKSTNTNISNGVVRRQFSLTGKVLGGDETQVCSANTYSYTSYTGVKNSERGDIYDIVVNGSPVEYIDEIPKEILLELDQMVSSIVIM